MSSLFYGLCIVITLACILKGFTFYYIFGSLNIHFLDQLLIQLKIGKQFVIVIFQNVIIAKSFTELFLRNSECAKACVIAVNCTIFHSWATYKYRFRSKNIFCYCNLHGINRLKNHGVCHFLYVRSLSILFYISRRLRCVVRT